MYDQNHVDYNFKLNMVVTHVPHIARISYCKKSGDLKYTHFPMSFERAGPHAIQAAATATFNLGEIIEIYREVKEDGHREIRGDIFQVQAVKQKDKSTKAQLVKLGNSNLVETLTKVRNIFMKEKDETIAELQAKIARLQGQVSVLER